jgi:hypothetical protein
MPALDKEANINLAIQVLKQDPQLKLYRASEIFKVSRNSYNITQTKDSNLWERVDVFHDSKGR